MDTFTAPRDGRGVHRRSIGPICSTPSAGRGETAIPGPLEREFRGHSDGNRVNLLPGPSHLWNRLSHMAASASHRCLLFRPTAAFDRRNRRSHSSSPRASHRDRSLPVLRGLPGHEFQYPRETRDEREMPGPFDENVFRLRRQRLREALGVIPHEGQVISSAPYTRTGTATCASASSVKGAVFGAMSTMARTRGPRKSGISPTFRVASASQHHRRSRTWNRRDAVGSAQRWQRDSASRRRRPARCSHRFSGPRPRCAPADVGTESRILQQRIDDAGDLLRPPDPHADTGDVVVLSSWARRGGDDIAMRGQRHR